MQTRFIVSAYRSTAPINFRFAPHSYLFYSLKCLSVFAAHSPAAGTVPRAGCAVCVVVTNPVAIGVDESGLPVRGSAVCAAALAGTVERSYSAVGAVVADSVAVFIADKTGIADTVIVGVGVILAVSIRYCRKHADSSDR